MGLSHTACHAGPRLCLLRLDSCLYLVRWDHLQAQAAQLSSSKSETVFITLQNANGRQCLGVASAEAEKVMCVLADCTLSASALPVVLHCTIPSIASGPLHCTLEAYWQCMALESTHALLLVGNTQTPVLTAAPGCHCLHAEAPVMIAHREPFPFLFFSNLSVMCRSSLDSWRL